MSNDNAMTDHAYDGIQEFDNPLPGWWKWSFVASIVFSVFYAMYFHIGAPGRSIIDQYETELNANTRLQFAEIGNIEPNAESVLRFMQEDSWLAVGKVVFKTNCISCHGRDGEGKVGPNLADEFYKNVRKLDDIPRIINSGAGNGAMPAWGNRLHVNEVVMVSAYVAKLRGSAADGTGKGPEGSEIPPWPEPTNATEAAPQNAPAKSGEEDEGH